MAAIARLFVVLLFVGLGLKTSAAQVVSLKCCATANDRFQMGKCMGGPEVHAAPIECSAAATCVVGFGPNTEAMPGLCDSGIEPDDPARAYCTEWHHSPTPATTYCVANSNSTITLFEVFDDENDGDLDLADFASFQNAYEPVPKQIQSQAVVVSVECCVPFDGVQRIAGCLSGPGELHDVGFCDLGSICVVGFSQLVEDGDRLNRLCRPGSTELPNTSDAFCTAWNDGVNVAAFSCQAAQAQGVTPFVVMDNDGDGDLDLQDFAAFQDEFALPAE